MKHRGQNKFSLQFLTFQWGNRKPSLDQEDSVLTNNFSNPGYCLSVKAQIALKEMELLNSIIARQEEIGLKIRGWYMALITALTVALFSNDFSLNDFAFAFLVIMLSVVFLIIEVTHRRTEQQAINRNHDIEEQLRNNNAENYNGPKIADSLREELFKNWKQALNFRIYITYVIVILFLAIGFFLKLSIF